MIAGQEFSPDKGRFCVNSPILKDLGGLSTMIARRARSLLSSCLLFTTGYNDTLISVYNLQIEEHDTGAKIRVLMDLCPK